MVDRHKQPYIYLSPHLDDVALSCGGRIFQQARAGERVMVVTVFAAAPEPDARLSLFARKLHVRWGRSDQALQTRREEDREALSLLGVEPLHWAYLDCIYRSTPSGHFPYSNEEALWGEIHVSDAGLIRELTRRIATLPSGMLYVPLAAGRHVDHRIVRQAAERSGRALTAYEDFPYAEDREAVQESLPEGDWRAELVSLSQEALEAKIAAIGRYRSQINTFWGDQVAMAASVRAFAERTGGGRPAERYWRVSSL